MRADRCSWGCRRARHRQSASRPRGPERQSRSRCGAPTDCEPRWTRARTPRRSQDPPPRPARNIRRRARCAARSATACGERIRTWRSSQHKDPSVSSDLRPCARGRHVSYVAQNRHLCNICFMTQPHPKSSPLNELCSALPSLPMRLREVGRFVAANDYDATTRSMRELAAVAGAAPASFTRLAQALVYAGWDELRAALTEARRPAQPSPFSGRAKGRRHGPNSDVSLVASKLEAEAAGLARISSGAIAGAAKALHTAERIWIAGFRSCRSVAELLNYQLRLFRPDTVQLVGGSGPEDLDLGAFHAGDAVVVIGFAPYSTASVLSARAAHRSGAGVIAITDTIAAPMAEGADHLLLFEAAASPGFFPSLTGAIAIAQSLAAVTFVLGGVGAKRRLEETEVRLTAMSEYVAEKG